MKLDGTQYRLVYCDIITGIYCGRWKKGDTLPSLEALCEQYEIGRNTARTAMRLLEENGYIVRCGKKQPEVCFDWDDQEHRGIYLEELAQRKQSIEYVAQFMITAMPELFSRIIADSTDGQREEIIGMLEKSISELPVCTEQEMAEGLMQVYMKALSFMENDLMKNLFYSLYYFMQVPMENPRSNLRFKTAIALIKFILKRFQGQVKRQDIDGLKEQIVFLCQSMKTNVGNYLNRVCKGIEPEERQEYLWIPHNNTEYFLLAVDIIDKINRGIYKGNEVLPSYAQLAREADVSEKTSRKAVKILNEWNIVTTINGVGSRVNEVGKGEGLKILEDEMVRENLNRFLDAMQIFTCTCRPVVKESVEHKTTERLRELSDGMTYEDVIQLLFLENTSPVVTSIYIQLLHILKWGRVLELCGMNVPDGREDKVPDMLKMLEKRKGKALAECIYCDAVQYYADAKQFLERIQ